MSAWKISHTTTRLTITIHRHSLQLVDWKNDNRREWVDMLTKAAEKETDSNVMRLLIKEANKLMKEVTK